MSDLVLERDVAQTSAGGHSLLANRMAAGAAAFHLDPADGCPTREVVLMSAYLADGEGIDDLARLGPKGAATRRRLMDSARELLEEGSAVALTSSAIAQRANLSPASFYKYFADIESIIHALCLEVTKNSRSIIDAIQPSADVRDARVIAARFVDAYDEFWCRHRSILSIRNMEAERGNAAFRYMRRAFVEQMMNALLTTALIVRRVPLTEPSERLAGRIAVVVAGVDRLAAVNGLYDPASSYPATPANVLRKAQIDILAAVLDPRIVYEELRRDIEAAGS